MSELRRVPRLTRKGLAHPSNSLAAALAGVGTAPSPLVASGHPFDPATGTGIVWAPDVLELWLRGERIEVADADTTSPADCWGRLAFVDAFFTVTHWWLGSPWTQQVRVTHTAQQPEGGTLVWLQAVQADADELPWLVEADGRASGPLPDYAGGALNLPLAARLGELARRVLAGQIAVNQWALVTSLVTADALPVLLGDNERAALLTIIAQGAES